MEYSLISVLQLRRAGSRAYLIDNNKAGLPYHKPIIVNETGAEMFELLKSAPGLTEAAEKMAYEYGIEKNVVLKDMERFLENIKEAYIIWK